MHCRCNNAGAHCLLLRLTLRHSATLKHRGHHASERHAALAAPPAEAAETAEEEANEGRGAGVATVNAAPRVDQPAAAKGSQREQLRLRNAVPVAQHRRRVATRPAEILLRLLVGLSVLNERRSHCPRGIRDERVKRRGIHRVDPLRRAHAL